MRRACTVKEEDEGGGHAWVRGGGPGLTYAAPWNMPYPSEVRAFLKLAEILLTSMLAVWMLPQSCIAKWVASARCGPEVGPVLTHQSQKYVTQHKISSSPRAPVQASEEEIGPTEINN